jgi:hypothetical protein
MDRKASGWVPAASTDRWKGVFRKFFENVS